MKNYIKEGSYGIQTKKTIKIIGIGLLFLFLIVYLSNVYIDASRLKNEHKYTIGIVNDISVNARLGENVYFTIIVRGVKYKTDDIIYIDMYGYTPTNIINKKFLVKYQPSNPKNCKIMLDYRVKDSVKAPPNGWESIPK